MHKKPMFTAAQRQGIFLSLSWPVQRMGKMVPLSCPGEILWASLKKFNCDLRTMHRIWERAKENFVKEGAFHASPRKKGCYGRKIICDPARMAESIENLPSNKRKTMRQISGAVGVSLWTVQKAQQSFLVPHTNSIKPFLTDANKYVRICYTVERMRYCNDKVLRYKTCFGSVHVA
jgi:hypothetical protein